MVHYSLQRYNGNRSKYTCAKFKLETKRSKLLEKNLNALRFPKLTKNRFWSKSTWSTLRLGVPIRPRLKPILLRTLC